MTNTHAAGDPSHLLSEIRASLRSILRLYEDLRTPLSRFVEIPEKAPGTPRFYVQTDLRPFRPIYGLKIGVRTLAFPEERIENRAWEFAMTVWHLKDWLRRWCEATGVAEDIEAYAAPSPDLMICADLANLKKHGESRKRRSGLDPDLVPVVGFDTSKNGVVEFFCDGARKEKIMLVSRPIPIPFLVRVAIHGGIAWLIEDAVTIIHRGMHHWQPLLSRLGMLSGTEPDVVFLRQAFSTPPASAVVM